ncbi:transient receptor potential cation channel subfamily A member 1-like [Teleopsis dalmanni]|uniref:transient receptor potential cation channel subfamily A member 1-like n=1 Tax=Teleopsis dalmanni TaxID=139649 RepID=UPI0018CE8B0F|nr:transient receptor potential cation channel subfamily A member 1-like [Teleopsis dalmanni]
MFAKIDERTGEPVLQSNPTPLPALNIKYSFHPFQLSHEEIEKRKLLLNDPKWRPAPLCVVNTMVNHGRVELLAHPLSQKYLQMKWNSYGKYFHLTNLLIYSIFLLFVTIYSSLMMNGIELRNAANKQEINISKNEFEGHNHSNWFPAVAPDILLNTPCYESIRKSSAIVVCAVAIIVYITLNSLREIIQMYQQRLHYILEIVNLISWVLYISALIMVTPVFDADGRINTIHYSAASIAVFLSWFRLLLFLQRFDQS